jgi:PAS domain S-box-containing protein
MSEFALENLMCHRDNLEHVLDNLKEGIIAHDMNRRIFFFNQAAERISGYSRKDVLGKDCHKAFGHPFCGGLCQFSDKAPDVTESSENTLSITTRSGESRRVEMSITRMKGDDGEFVGVLTSFRDITDLFSLQLQAGKLTSFGNIIGQDHKMYKIFKHIRDVSAYDYPVHVSGETGTGKELVAYAIHNESSRNGAALVPINCGALPEGLIESELFGHVKGAFSGAIRNKKGRFELADGGTAFLDEAAELSNNMQAKLLRFLQDRQFERVGGENTLSVDVRIISATNKNLKEAVKKGQFREDLYYRLNVIPIHMPPLRERKIDIPLLIERFLQEAAERYGRDPLKVSTRAMSLLLDYHWPGNVRELQNAVQFAFVKCSDNTLEADDLPMELREVENTCIRRGPAKKLNSEGVRAAIIKTGGNKAKAAKLLGVGRATLYRFLSDHPELSDAIT